MGPAGGVEGQQPTRRGRARYAGAAGTPKACAPIVVPRRYRNEHLKSSDRHVGDATAQLLTRSSRLSSPWSPRRWFGGRALRAGQEARCTGLRVERLARARPINVAAALPA